MQEKLNQLALQETPQTSKSKTNTPMQSNLDKLKSLNFTDENIDSDIHDLESSPVTSRSNKNNKQISSWKQNANVESIDISKIQHEDKAAEEEIPEPETNQKTAEILAKIEENLEKQDKLELPPLKLNQLTPEKNSKSPEKATTNDSERVKRLSIANQDSARKLELEEKRKQFVEKMENKRMNERNNRTFSQSSRSKPTNDNSEKLLKNRPKSVNKTISNTVTEMPKESDICDSPELFTNRRAKTSVLDKNPAPPVQSTEPSKQQIMQERREKALQKHREEKKRIENTINPKPAISHRSISSHALSSARPKSVSSNSYRHHSGTGSGNPTNPKNKNVNHDNKQQIIQAIEKTCLPGPVNLKERKMIIEAIHNLKNDTEHHLLVLFRNDRFLFRGVYRLAKTRDSIICLPNSKSLDSGLLPASSSTTVTSEATTAGNTGSTNTTNTETTTTPTDLFSPSKNSTTSSQEQNLLMQHFIKVAGKGPSKIDETGIKSYYSYSTGRKSFNPINGSTFGFNACGMTIDESFWSKLKPKKMEVRK